ncbi:MAG: hypothetical protein ACJ762_06380 [Solirubrobacteraceae bacterium]
MENGRRDIAGLHRALLAYDGKRVQVGVSDGTFGGLVITGVLQVERTLKLDTVHARVEAVRDGSIALSFPAMGLNDWQTTARMSAKATYRGIAIQIGQLHIRIEQSAAL